MPPHPILDSHSVQLYLYHASQSELHDTLQVNITLARGFRAETETGTSPKFLSDVIITRHSHTTRHDASHTNQVWIKGHHNRIRLVRLIPGLPNQLLALHYVPNTLLNRGNQEQGEHLVIFPSKLPFPSPSLPLSRQDLRVDG